MAEFDQELDIDLVSTSLDGLFVRHALMHQAIALGSPRSGVRFCAFPCPSLPELLAHETGSAAALVDNKVEAARRVALHDVDPGTLLRPLLGRLPGRKRSRPDQHQLPGIKPGVPMQRRMVLE